MEEVVFQEVIAVPSAVTEAGPLVALRLDDGGLCGSTLGGGLRSLEVEKAEANGAVSGGIGCWNGSDKMHGAGDWKMGSICCTFF